MAKPPAATLLPGIDVAGMVGGSKSSGGDVDALVSLQRKNIEALTHANKLALEKMQVMFTRQAEIVRLSIEESTTVTGHQGKTGSPLAKAVRQTEMTKEALEQALSNSRELAEFIVKNNSEAFELLNQRFFQILDELKDDIAKVAEHKTGLGAPLIAAFLDESGQVAVERVAESFGMSKSQLADTLGLGRETFHKSARAKAAKTQSRILEMLEVVSRISAWAGGKDQAMAWYRAQPISAFGDRTAEALVKSGRAAAVRDYLDHLAIGGFA